MTVPRVSHDQKSHVTLHYECFYGMNGMVLFMMLLASDDATSYDQESHVVPCFNCLDLMNAFVSLIMLSVLHDANTSIT